VRRWADHRKLSRLHETEGLQRWRLHRHCVVELVDGKPLPSGWYGKPWALTQGAELCGDSRWLLFLDADTRLRLGAAAALVGAAEQRGLDMLSILTNQRLVTWWEKLLQPSVFGAIAFAFPPDASNDPRHPEIAIANGQCLLARRAAYEALGGHRAVRASIAEDQQIAALFKQAGKRVMLADGRTLAETRMYDSLGAFWEGWTKNIFQASGGSFGLTAAAVAFFGIGQLAPAPLALLAWSQNQRPAAAFWGASFLIQVALRRSMDRWAGLGPAWSLTQPVGSAVFVGLMLGSAWRAARGTTAWRGRIYDVRRAPLAIKTPSLLTRIRLALS
jgi:chlorobactene glucosyltransferase